MCKFKTTYSEYKKYNLLEITKVIRKLTSKEVDKEVGPMYEIRLENNVILECFSDEIVFD